MTISSHSGIAPSKVGKSMAIEARDLLISILVNAGVGGIRQRDLTHRMRNVATVKEFMPILEQWRRAHIVQRFTITDQPHRPTTIWRATEKLGTLT
jgi:hypothetical protein